jgi:hypothetical protein
LLGGKMGIFKCLQGLWRFSCGSRLFQWLFITGSLALIIGFVFLKKFSLEEKAFTCFKNNKVILFFHSSKSSTPHVSLPIKSVYASDDFTFTEIVIKEKKWKIAALSVLSVGDLMADLSMKGGEKCLFPMIVVARDSSGAEYLIIGNEQRQVFLSSMNYLVEHNMLDNKKWVEVICSDEENDKQPLSLCIKMK